MSTAEGPRIDFYILEDGRAGGRERFACRLTDKAVRAGHAVYLLAESEALRGLDELLWTFSQASFIPHAVVRPDGSGPAVIDPATPVVVADGPPAPEQCRAGTRRLLLINLTSRPVAGFERLERLAEIVDPEQRAPGRERFRYYREHGFEPVIHRIHS
jgi:DNA polymerase-3 subunit chi